MIEAEQERYAGWGLETPRVPWGIHPELLEIPVVRDDDEITRFVFPGGFLGHRKPLEPVAEAFARTANPDIRLLVKAQVERSRLGKLNRQVRKDKRIEFALGDEEWAPHLMAIAACDVCITPSRWEGLGLPLYEAMAFGQPVITNDDPPMNEVVTDGVNGLLVPSHADGVARSGIEARRPDPEALTAAIERLADPACGPSGRRRGAATSSPEPHPRLASGPSPRLGEPIGIAGRIPGVAGRGPPRMRSPRPRRSAPRATTRTAWSCPRSGDRLDGGATESRTHGAAKPQEIWQRSSQPPRRSAEHRRVPAAFVVGVNRSGTTLLRMMLDAHPELTMPPETHFVPELIDVAESGKAKPEDLLATITKQREWGDFGLTEEQLLEAFARDRAAQRGRRAARLLLALRGADRQAALGREDADLREEHPQDRPGPARGALRARDPRRP